VQLLNFFLSALKPEDRAALNASMAEVSLSPAQPMFEVGDEIDALYFPGSACVSLVTVLSDGKAVETATIGRESVVSLIDALAHRPSRSRVLARSAAVRCACRHPRSAPGSAKAPTS